MTAECPCAGTILGLLRNALDAERAEGVREHIDVCDLCRTLVARLLVSRGNGPNDPTPPIIGTTIAGRYRVDRQLGSGSMGVVYGAWDERLEREVALKAVPARGPGRGPRIVERLLRESKAMAKLRHPNVVTVHDVVGAGESLFLAMELVDGETLRQWCSRERRSVAEILDALRQAGQGLSAAHEAGLVHRDFKPDNILVGPEGRVLVTDFGLARASLERESREVASFEFARGDPGLTESGAVLGTPAYMAPEQWSGERADPRCDIFAFCVTAFEALYGSRPYSGLTVAEVQQEKVAGSFEIPGSPTIPRRIRRVIVQGLSADPDKRPQSMSEVLVRLRVRRSRRGLIAFGAAVGAAAAIVALSAREGAAKPEAEPTVCAEHDALAAAWSSERRTAIGSAWADSPAWARVEPALDQHVAAWQSAWWASCSTTQHSEEQKLALELRRSCLDAQGRRLRTTLRVLEAKTTNPDAALRWLPPVAACETERLGVIRPAPADAVLRADVEAIRADLAEVQAEQKAGLARRVAPRMEDLTRQARRLDFAPLLAEALYVQGVNASLLGESSAARSLLVESAQAAASGAHDVAAVDAWLRLIEVATTDLGDVARAREYASLARGTIERLGDAPVVPQMQVRFALQLGGLEMAENDLSAAEQTLRRGIALAREHSPSYLPQLKEALALTYQSSGRPQEAIAIHRENLEARISSLGEAHPHVVVSLMNLSGALSEAGRHEEALQHSARALTLARREGGPPSDDVLRLGVNRASDLLALDRVQEALGEVERLSTWVAESGGKRGILGAHIQLSVSLVYFELGRTADGVKAVRRGLAIAEPLQPMGEVTNVLRISLADGLADLGNHEEALALAEEAVEIQRATPNADPLYAIMTDQTMANVLLESGNEAEAAVRFKDVVRRYAALDYDRGMLFQAQLQLIDALWRAGQKQESRRLLYKVRSTLGDEPEDRGERRQLANWAQERRL